MVRDESANPPEGHRWRIAYLVHGVGGRETGVRTKILGQAAAWSEIDPNVEVGLFVRCETGTQGAWRNEPHVVAARSSNLWIAGRFVAREVLSLQLARWQPDVIYLRQSTVSPTVIALATAFPTVIEVNSDDLEELRMRSPLRYWYARLTRDLLLRRAVGIVVVTHELARLPAVRRLGRPITVVPNSIDLADYPSLPAPKNDQPHLVFLGAPGLPWAGVDKIARLAAHFPRWRFDVVGPSPDELPDPPANVVTHGPLDREAYLPIMAQADVAIGPLALHRVGLSESSSLKVAEYLAYGIPVILGNAHTAFPDKVPFLLQLPNNENNIEIAEQDIRDYVLGWRGQRVDRMAITAVDSRLVEQRRLDLIRHLAFHPARESEAR